MTTRGHKFTTREKGYTIKLENKKVSSLMIFFRCFLDQVRPILAMQRITVLRHDARDAT